MKNVFLGALLVKNKQGSLFKPEIIIVSGLPRSGTSMLMKILEAGGIPPLTDGIREADENNPRGYYEFERVKALPEGDTAWLSEAEGKAVKIISALLKYLPDYNQYRVLYMERKMAEILASQRKMLQDRGKDPEQVSDLDMAALFTEHNQGALDWLGQQQNIQSLILNYNQIITEPEKEIQRIADFMEWDLNQQAMADVVDRRLYRQRKPG